MVIKMTEHYLQGSGNRNDAIFRILLNGRVHVVAEVGMTGCIDEEMSVKEARGSYRNLINRGWKEVSVSRTDFDTLRKRVQD